MIKTNEEGRQIVCDHRGNFLGYVEEAPVEVKEAPVEVVETEEIEVEED